MQLAQWSALKEGREILIGQFGGFLNSGDARLRFAFVVVGKLPFPVYSLPMEDVLFKSVFINLILTFVLSSTSKAGVIGGCSDMKNLGRCARSGLD